MQLIAGDTADDAADQALLARALRTAATAGPGAASRPGQLRGRLVAELGDDAQRLAPLVHRLVVAAEEHVPARLAEQTPVGQVVADRIAATLAASRGWTFAAASEAVLLWGQSLGLLEEGVVRDTEPAGGSDQPSDETPRNLVLSPQPVTGPSTQAAAPAAPTPAPDADWPPLSRRFRRLLAQVEPDAVSAGDATGRFHPRVGLAIVLVFAALALLALAQLVPIGPSGALVAFVGLVLRQQMHMGVLVARPDGVAFYRTRLNGRLLRVPPRTASWTQVAVHPGPLPSVQIDGGRRLGLFRGGGRFVRALRAHAGSAS